MRECCKLTWDLAESDESWRRRRARLSRRWSCFARLHPDNRRLFDGTKAPGPLYRVSRPSRRFFFFPFTLHHTLSGRVHLSFTWREIFPFSSVTYERYCSSMMLIDLLEKKDKFRVESSKVSANIHIIRNYINRVNRDVCFRTSRLIFSYTFAVCKIWKWHYVSPEIKSNQNVERSCRGWATRKLGEEGRKEKEERMSSEWIRAAETAAFENCRMCFIVTARRPFTGTADRK